MPGSNRPIGECEANIDYDDCVALRERSELRATAPVHHA
jgi:hypothetical protein